MSNFSITYGGMYHVLRQSIFVAYIYIYMYVCIHNVVCVYIYSIYA